MLQQPMADVRLQLNSLVVMELGGVLFSGIIVDDDLFNPIRMVRHANGVMGMLADELTEVDRETFEMVLALETREESE